jgi:hypothetical protein
VGLINKILNIMNNIIKFTTILLFIFTCKHNFSQDTGMEASQAGSKTTTYVKMTIRSSPSFTIQFSGSYNYGVYELSANDNGDFSSQEFMEGENFGVRHGLGSALTMKIPLHEQGNVRLNISGMYNNFSSKYIDGLDKGFVNYNVISGGVGIENNFTPNFRFKTLVGASIIGSVISGNARVYDASYNTSDITIIPAFRMGLSVYSGFEYLLTDKIGTNFGFSFTHSNLWLKQTKQSDNPNEIYLNDKRVVPRQPYSGFRQFAWGSFYAGLNYYFGVQKKQYIFRKY